MSEIARRFGFRARFVPGIADNEAGETRRAEADREQQAFWESIQFNHSTSVRKLAFEVRFVAHETTRQIDVWLLFETQLGQGRTKVDEEDETDIVADIGRLLPKEYGWEWHRDLDHVKALPRRAGAGRWWTSRAVRRLVFADIPHVAELDVETPKSSSKPDRQSQLEAQQEPMQGVPDRFVVGLDDEPLRDEPPSGGVWVMPLIMAVQPQRRIAVTFFEQLQAAAPASVSIRASRLSPEALPPLRVIANHYMQQNFGPLSAGIERSYGGEAASYHRYLLPDDLFDVLDINFASASRDGMDALYHSFNAQVGGHAGFHQVDIRDRRNLLTFAQDLPMVAFLENSIEKRQGYLMNDLSDFHVEGDIEDPLVERFLLDAPYVYTFHEIQAVLKLPIADERGLPGIDCRAVAPFNSPSLSYDPVRRLSSLTDIDDEEKEGELRIGMRGRVRLVGDPMGGPYKIAEEEGAAHWHRIPKSDLTKHALVVGSTGSGKSVTTLFLLRELHRTGLPFCVIEPVKTEYYD